MEIRFYCAVAALALLTAGCGRSGDGNAARSAAPAARPPAATSVELAQAQREIARLRKALAIVTAERDEALARERSGNANESVRAAAQPGRRNVAAPAARSTPTGVQVFRTLTTTAQQSP